MSRALRVGSAAGKTMTKEEAQLYKERWRLVNEVTIEEARRAPASLRLRQLAMLFAAGQDLGWQERMRAGEEEVHARWQRLRAKLRA